MMRYADLAALTAEYNFPRPRCTERPTKLVVGKFQSAVKCYYKYHGRSLPWRSNITPYRTLVSEVMLQQTQVARVTEAFPRFIKTYPSIRALASADTRQLLQVWQGMGYNRRALNLRAAAVQICDTYSGRVPSEPGLLAALPGIGKYTSHSVPVFAFDLPYPVVETNIRAVMTYFFCKGLQEVSEQQIESLVLLTLDRDNPRDWFNALMDLGAEIKRHDSAINKRVVSYKRQSKFKGSRREIRGQVLRELTKTGRMKGSVLANIIVSKDYSVLEIADELVAEGFLVYRRGEYFVCAGHGT